MDLASIIVVAGLLITNAVSWVIMLKRGAFNSGQLAQRVENLDNTINNGLCEKVDGISRHVAKLEGKVDTYIEFHESRRILDEEERRM